MGPTPRTCEKTHLTIDGVHIYFWSAHHGVHEKGTAHLAASMGVIGLALIWWLSVVGIADVIFAYEVAPFKGTMHWLFEGGVTRSPSELINWLGVITLWHTSMLTFLAYWLLKRHRPRYESKLNATYYKVR